MTAKFWIGGTGTWDNTNDLNWSLSTGGANNTTHPVAGDTVTLDGASGGGTVTVNATLALTTLTTSAFTGTLDFSANNNSITISGNPGWTDAATGVHTTSMGNGTWTFTSVNGTPVSLTAGANHTLNANGSTILLSAVPTGSRAVNLGAKTVNNVTVTNAAFAPFMVDFNNNGGVTIAGNLTLTNVGGMRMPSAGTVIVTGTITWDVSPTNQAILFTTNAASTLSVGSANVLSWLTVQNLTKAGAGSITVNNGFDGGGNTGITINMPQRLLGGGMSGGMRG